MKIKDWTLNKYKNSLINNCKDEWHLYQDIISDIKSNPSGYSLQSFWIERGAFIKVLPRQIGKTTFLMQEAIANDGMVIVESIINKNRLKKQFNYNKIFVCDDIKGNMMPQNEWLFIDEYDILSRDALHSLLCFDWKGIMMLSSCWKRV